MKLSSSRYVSVSIIGVWVWLIMILNAETGPAIGQDMIDVIVAYINRL